MSEEDKKHISKLRKIEGNIKNSIDAIEIKETHYFAHNTYARGVRIKKGSFVTGKIHRYSVMNILMEGVLRVKTSGGLERYEAPCVIIGAPGTKRAVFAEEDSFWLTIHATDQTDPELIEKEVIIEEYEDLMIQAPRHKPGGLTALENKTLNLLLKKKEAPLTDCNTNRYATNERKNTVENQHRQIKGYRDLTQEEVAQMNEVKELAEQCGALISRMEAHSESNKRSVALAKTNLQQGFMWAVRSIARPSTF